MLVLLVLVVGSGFAGDDEAASGDPKRVKTVFFDEVETDDVALAVMDGGTHGVQGHTIVVDSDGAATWEQRLDGLRSRGRAGRGSLQLTDDERTQLETWSRATWDVAGPSGRATFFVDPSHGPPRWVWAVVVGRGGEIRLVEGTALGRLRQPVPAPLRPLLDWLVRRVDEVSQQAPMKQLPAGRLADDTIEGHWNSPGEAERLDSAGAPTAPAGWAGTWIRAGDTEHDSSWVEISRADARGFAFILGATSGGHTGEISGRATVKPGRATWRDAASGCQVSFMMKHAAMTVALSHACSGFGGIGVVFGGLYRRHETQRPLSLRDQGILDEAQEKELRRLAGDDFTLFESSFHLVFEDEDQDGLGARVRSGGVRGLFTEMEAIIMTAAGGKIWAAVIDSGDDTVKYFTNDPAWVRRLPKTIDVWRQRFAHKKVVFPDK